MAADEVLQPLFAPPLHLSAWWLQTDQVSSSASTGRAPAEARGRRVPLGESAATAPSADVAAVALAMALVSDAAASQDGLELELAAPEEELKRAMVALSSESSSRGEAHTVVVSRRTSSEQRRGAPG